MKADIAPDTSSFRNIIGMADRLHPSRCRSMTDRAEGTQALYIKLLFPPTGCEWNKEGQVWLFLDSCLQRQDFFPALIYTLYLPTTPCWSSKASLSASSLYRPWLPCPLSHYPVPHWIDPVLGHSFRLFTTSCFLVFSICVFGGSNAFLPYQHE